MNIFIKVIVLLGLSVIGVQETSQAILLGGDVEVKTPTGYTKVSDLKAGDVVKTFNGQKFYAAKVARCFTISFKGSQMRFLEFAGMTIKVSPKIKTIAEVYPSVEWKEIDAGDEICLISYLPRDQWNGMLVGRCVYSKSEIKPCEKGIYNLHLEDGDNLVITCADILISWS